MLYSPSTPSSPWRSQKSRTDEASSCRDSSLAASAGNSLLASAPPSDTSVLMDGFLFFSPPSASMQPS